MSEQEQAQTQEITTTEATWYSDGDRDFVANKAWKSPQDAINAYKELEKFRGAPEDRLLKLPEKDDPQEWGKVWQKLGRPESPDKYEATLDFGEGVEVQAEAIDGLKKAMFEAGATNKQVAAALDFYKSWASPLIEQQMNAQREFEAQVQRDVEVLEKELGDKFDEFVAGGRRAVEYAGFTEEAIDKIEKALGTADTYRLFGKLGNLFAEGEGIEAKAASGSGFVTPEKAKAEIDRLKGDKDFVSRYMSNDKSAHDELRKLEKIAYGL